MDTRACDAQNGTVAHRSQHRVALVTRSQHFQSWNLQPWLRPELPLLVYLPICCNIGKSTFCLPGPHQVVGLAPLVRVRANVLGKFHIHLWLKLLLRQQVLVFQVSAKRQQELCLSMDHPVSRM